MDSVESGCNGKEILTSVSGAVFDMLSQWQKIKNACRDGSRLGVISKNECEVSGGSMDIRNNGKCVIIGTSGNNKEYD